MPHRRIVIGDVHGHYDTLISLLDAIAPNSDDEIYFLGDLIDRGPQSAKVVSFVMENSYSCLLGNHEHMLLGVLGEGDIDYNQLQGWLYSGGYATLLSYDHQIPQEHINWMKTLPNYLDLGDIWLVHGGVHPTIPLENQTSENFCWIRDEFHRISQPYFEDKLIIIGHTITFTFPGVSPGKVVSGSGWLDIDTGVYHPKSGWLTGFDVTHEKVYQVHQTDKTRRTLSLAEAVVTIEPGSILAKRSITKQVGE